MQDRDRFVLLSVYKILISLVDLIYHCFFDHVFQKSVINDF